MVFVLEPSKEMHVVVSGKTKVKLLQQLKEAAEEADIRLEVHQKPKGENGDDQVDAALSAAKIGGKRIGSVRDEMNGSLMDVWQSKVEAESMEHVDVSAGLGELLSPQDAENAKLTRSAAKLTGKVLSHSVDNRLVEAVEQERKVTHDRLSEEISGMLSDPSRAKLNFSAELCESAHTPVIQSNGKYALRFDAGSNKEHLDTNRGSTVVVSLGARYSGCPATVSRTLMVHPSDARKHAYESLLEAQEAAIRACEPGASVNAPYEAAKAALPEDLTPYLHEDVGFPLSQPFAERSHALGPKGRGKILAGMALNVSIGLQGHDEDGKPWAMWVGDTVLVADEAGQEPEVLTKVPDKGFGSVAFYFEEEEEDEEEEEGDQKAEGGELKKEKGGDVEVEEGKEGEGDDEGKENRKKPTRAQAQENQQPKLTKMTESELYSKQKELAERKSKETYERLMGQGKDGEGASGSGQGRRDPVAYSNPKDVPTGSVTKAEVMVDRSAEAVLLPIFGAVVPIHVAAVRSINASSEGSRWFLRINFHHPAISKQAQASGSC